MAELTARRGDQRLLPRRARARRRRDGDGRGRRPRRRRLPGDAGLRDRFGPDRCVDTPLAEAGILGGAVGLCMAGFKPVCEMQYDAFTYPCLDQLITHVGRYRWRSGGQLAFPLTVRMPYGGGVRAPELHDDSPEAYYVHTPRGEGRDPVDARRREGLLAAAIRDPDPVVVLEPKLHYRTLRGEVPEGEHVVPLGKARLAREGDDLTLVGYGSMIPVCEAAADGLRRVGRGARHPDTEAARRGRAARVGGEDRPRGDRAGGAAHVRIRRRARGHPRREGDPRPRGPVLRVTGYDVPYPYWQIEDAYMPSVERVVDAARKLLEF